MLVSIIAQAIGLLCLSLTMDKHFKSAFKIALPPKLKAWLKFSGWTSVGVSVLLFVLFAHTPAIAIIYWLAMLSGNILVLALSYSQLASGKK